MTYRYDTSSSCAASTSTPPFPATYCLPYQYKGCTPGWAKYRTPGWANALQAGQNALGKRAPGWANGDSVLRGGRTVSLLFRRPPTHLVGLVNVELKSWKSTAIY